MRTDKREQKIIDQQLAYRAMLTGKSMRGQMDFCKYCYSACRDNVCIVDKNTSTLNNLCARALKEMRKRQRSEK